MGRKFVSNSRKFNSLANKSKFKKNIQYLTNCEYCNKDFSFTYSDVIDNVVKCPHCNSDNVVFLSQFK